MNTLFSTLSASEAQELRGGDSFVTSGFGTPSNGTGSNAGGTRNPATEAGFSEEKGKIPDYNGKGVHYGWIDFISGLG